MFTLFQSVSAANNDKTLDMTEVSSKKRLTFFCPYGIVIGRMEELRSFFYAQNQRKTETNKKLKWRWKSCAQRLHWHVQNANNVTTT